MFGLFRVPTALHSGFNLILSQQSEACVCVFTLECVGMSKLMTQSTCGMSKPRDATSVASRTERDLDLNLLRAPRRLFWTQRPTSDHPQSRVLLHHRVKTASQRPPMDSGVKLLYSRQSLFTACSQSDRIMISDDLSVYLTHLSVERDGCDTQVSEQ